MPGVNARGGTPVPAVVGPDAVRAVAARFGISAAEVTPLPGERTLTWLPGRVWVDAPPPRAARLRALGATIARVDRALAGFDHPRLGRRLRWNLTTAAEQRALLPHVRDPRRRALAGSVLDRFAD